MGPLDVKNMTPVFSTPEVAMIQIHTQQEGGVDSQVSLMRVASLHLMQATYQHSHHRSPLRRLILPKQSFHFGLSLQEAVYMWASNLG